MTCEFCNESDPKVQEEHHLIPARMGGSDADENMITVCANCHRRLERVYNERFLQRAQHRIISKLDEGPIEAPLVYCPACAETFEVGEYHHCTRRGESGKWGVDEGVQEAEDSISDEEQARLAQAYRNQGKALQWIVENVEEVDYSREWIRLNTVDNTNGENA